MTNPNSQVTEQARELLAREYERDAVPYMAQILRTRGEPLSPFEERSVRAIVRALDTARQSEGMVLVPREPITGPRYEAGEWSRRNWEAAIADQGIVATDLLEACRRLIASLHVMVSDGDNDGDIVFARAAIAKASQPEREGRE